MARPRADGGFTRRDLLDQIADKWTALILHALCKGPLRFNTLRRSLDGITQTALTNTLRRLERNGILARRVASTKPIAVEYEITPLGRSLEPLFMALDKWTETYFQEVQSARDAFAQVAN